MIILKTVNFAKKIIIHSNIVDIYRIIYIFIYFIKASYV